MMGRKTKSPEKGRKAVFSRMAEINIKVILEYDGSRYDGWQRQGNTEKTIQGKLEQVLERMAGGPVEVHGSGRTDAGVHALGQAANFHLPESCPVKEPGAILSYLNQYLPEDIAVLQAGIVSPRFHSRLNAISKTYLYRIEMAPKKSVFQRRYVYGLGRSLDVAAMEAAAEELLGSHDFAAFCSLKRMKKSTVRRIETISIRQRGTQVEISFKGNGFLYNMVRIMTGTLIEAGLHQRDAASVREALLSKDRSKAGYTAPAEGLFLERVEYPAD